MFKKQSYFPSQAERDNAITFDDYAMAQSEDIRCVRHGKVWSKSRIYHDQSLLLQVADGYSQGKDQLCVKQEGYIQFHFRLRGVSTTVFDGYGEYDQYGQQVLITASPIDAVKLDRMSEDVRHSFISVCVLPDFLLSRMGFSHSALPACLRTLVSAQEMPFTAHSFPLFSDIALACQGLLSASLNCSFLPRAYYPAKAIELLSLLFSQMYDEVDKTPMLIGMSGRKTQKLFEVRDYLNEHFAESLTLDRIAKSAGMSKTGMTSGFKSLFGLSVFDFIHKERMEYACVLLRAREYSISQIAERVGFSHASSFSTSFQRYFGECPRKIYGDIWAASPLHPRVQY